MPTRDNSREALVCLLLLALVPVVMALLPSVPLTLQHALFLPPWDGARPNGLVHAPDPFDRIHVLQTYPWYHFLSDSGARPSALLWDPNEGFGAPFFALWRTRALSPFTIPIYLFSLPLALRLSVMLKLLVAGWSAYYAARRLHLKPAMALFVGISFELSAPMMLWTALGIGDVLPWFPLLLLAVERLMLGEWRGWPWLTVMLALMGLGGDPESVGGALCFVTLYMLVRRIRDRRWAHLWPALRGLVTAIIFAAGLCAIQLAPYIEFTGQGQLHALLPNAVLNWGNLTALVAPGWSPAAQADAARHIPLLHMGLVTLLLFPLWFAIRRHVSKSTRRCAEALSLSALILFLVPLVLGNYWEGLYALGQFGPQHLLLAHVFIFAFIVAAGAEEWNELNPERCRETVRRLFFYLPIGWGLIFVATPLVMLFQGAPVLSVLGVLLRLLLAGLAILAVLAITVARPSVRVMGYSLSALSAACLLWVLAPMMPRTPDAQVFPETPMTGSLKSMVSRVGGSAMLSEWPLSAHNIPQVYSTSGVGVQRQEDFLDRAKNDPLLLRRYGLQGLLLTKEDIKGVFASERPDLNVQEVYPSGAVLFKDLKARNRAAMIYQGRRVSDFNPAQIDASAPPLLEGSTLPNKDTGPVANAWIDSSETETRITVKIEKTRPGVLVLADAWYPGWTATVDGKPVEVIPVDGAFRGVEVGEGEHQVEFLYTQFSLKLGKWITIVAAIWVLISFRALIFRRRMPFEVIS